MTSLWHELSQKLLWMNRYKFCTSANSVSNLSSETNQTVIGIKFRGISFLGLPLETDQTDFCANIWVKVYWVVGENKGSMNRQEGYSHTSCITWRFQENIRLMPILDSSQCFMNTWSHSLAWSLLADTTDTDCIYKNIQDVQDVYGVKGMSHETCVCWLLLSAAGLSGSQVSTSLPWSSASK